MTDYTLNHSLPFPEGNDGVVVHTDIERLAKRADTTLESVKQEVTNAAAQDATDKTNAVQIEASQDATTKANAARDAAIQDATQKYGDIPSRLTGVEKELGNIGESSKKYRLLTAQDVLHELPPGRYALASNGIASAALGYPINQRGLLYVDPWNNTNTSRIMRYFAEGGDVFTRAVSLTNLREWKLLTPATTYLTANDHVADLPPGKYAVGSSGIASPERGYPTTARGVLIVESYHSSNANRIVQYFAEDGGAWVQVIASGTPQGWVSLTGGGGNVPPSPTENVDPYPRLVANTEPGHGFYKASTAGTFDADDTTTKPVGTQSIRVSTGGDGTNVEVQSDEIGPINILHTNPKLWLRAENWANAATLYVYLGTDGMTDHYRWILSQPANRAFLEEGLWRQQTLSEISAANTAGNPDPTRLTHLRIISSDDAAGSFTYNMGPIYATPKSKAFPNGVVSMSFDDGRLNNYEVARPIMDRYGFPGTAYVVAYTIGNSGSMTVEQLREMQEFSGWEIGSHTYAPGFHAERLTAFTEEELETDMANFRQWQKDNHLQGDTYAYPGGTYNDLVKRVTLRYFKAGRGIARLWETLPPGDLGVLNTPEYVSYPRTTPADIQEKVLQAQEHGAWLHICFHGVQAESTSSLEYPAHLFEEICQILYDSGIPVRTVQDVIDEL